ncbi:formyltransferase family protein [Ulvibacter antarcticus]|uniref:Methionyl-tRNA formyltransferase n=1 Tax=Ulvibacter antarcticus TaxID=442714 RepID=A0A3L9YZB4_9FLAO|nr:formyltransferase family protein [Ulvibacter antarcticus]RMA65986.1 methionyl-tRNA formyltransferase [Ulvibacter antarcticus]
MEKTFIVLSEKKWHKQVYAALKLKFGEFKWVLIDQKEEFNLVNLENLKPEKIFIPHWSYIIPASIYENYECIVFHMTDLPYGRGGSPLQNLIVRGKTETKISALRVEKGLDTGDIYLKKPLSLSGTAEEIFIRSSSIIEQMIEEIVSENPSPKKQEGEIVLFQRRKPEESNIESISETKEVYDYIRMLDCEGYPNAYLENESFKFEFFNATESSNNEIIANVRIIKK